MVPSKTPSSLAMVSLWMLTFICVEMMLDRSTSIPTRSMPLQADGGIEEQALVHVPLGIEDAVAVAGLQLRGNRTGTLVYLYLVLVVDVAQHVVTRNGVAACCELVLLMLSSVM